MNNHVGWEQALIGTALYSPERIEEVAELRPGDFTGSHQEIWSQMLILSRSRALEPRALTEALRQSGHLDRLGGDFSPIRGEAYLGELLERRGSSITTYADKVLDHSVRKELELSLALAMSEAQDQHVPLDTVLDNAEQRLMNLRRNHLIDEGDSMADLAGIFSERVDAIRDDTYVPAYRPEIPDLRKILGYLEETDYMVVAGRPGEGKSSLLRYEFAKQAIKGKPVLIFNLENNPTEYPKYMVSMRTGIDSEKLKNAKLLSEAELKQVKASLVELGNLPIQIVTMGSPSIADIRRIARGIVNKKHTSLIGIDYIQLVKNGGGGNENDDITTSSTGARAIAMDFKVPVMAAAQLSRQIEHRGVNSTPALADLRGSGSLEQDATQVVFLRHVWNNPSEADIRKYPENVVAGQLLPVVKAVPVKLWVLKNRNGGVGTTPPIKFVKSTSAFQSLAP